MITVGIIANPASGKDIRRLVAHGSVFDNEEKASIVRRALLGLDAVGVERVLFMPESFGIVHRALKGVKLALETAPLDMLPFFTQDDSRRAAALLAEQGSWLHHHARRRRHQPRRGEGLWRRAADADLDRHQQRLPNPDRGHDRRAWPPAWWRAAWPAPRCAARRDWRYFCRPSLPCVGEGVGG